MSFLKKEKPGEKPGRTIEQKSNRTFEQWNNRTAKNRSIESNVGNKGMDYLIDELVG